MKQSEKLGLWLPEGSDPLEVERLSENFEKLDPLGGGLEAIKEGAGPGSLFMVSKYYKESIKNALLCNGGSAYAAAYPELFDVLSMKYGGTIGSSNVSAQYGITSTLGYPAAYNRDRDLFVSVNPSNKSIVIYQKGQTPQQIPGPASIQSYTAIVANAVSFGKWVWVRMGTGSTTFTCIYDLAQGAWVTKSGISAITHMGLYSYPLTDLGDYIAVVASLNGTPYIILTNKNTMNSVFVRTSGVSSLSLICVPVLNLDTPDDGKLYFASSVSNTNAANIELFSIEKAALSGAADQSYITVPGTLIKTLTNSTSMNTLAGSAIIYNGYIYMLDRSARICANQLSSSSKTVTSIYTGSSLNTYNLSSVIAVEPGALVLFCGTCMPAATSTTAEFVSSKRYYIIEGLICTATSTSYNGLGCMASLGDKVVCTSTGPLSDIGFSSFKLPSISMSEALVYIRT